jgi:AraC-like DNA-binding protein
MDSTYCEFPPSPNLAPFVECFWTGDVVRDHTARILPDGCADILFFMRGSEVVDAQIVGVMTRPHLVSLTAGISLRGVRFHPGMAGVCLPCNLPEYNDKAESLRSVFGSVADDFVRRVSPHRSVARQITALEDGLARLPTITQTQRAIGELVGNKGQLSIETFAALAGVSERQLRRTCIEHSGLAPKQLARILRFRHAIDRLRKGERAMSELALDCGFYDQSHMIREFRSLASISPARYLRQRSG